MGRPKLPIPNPHLCRSCNGIMNSDTALPSHLKKSYGKCKSCQNKQKRALSKKLKKEAIRLLGGKCACCGIIDIDKLSIDHLYGGGRKEVKNLQREGVFRKIIKNENRNDEYQCLCFNCNCSKGFWGVCFHDI